MDNPELLLENQLCFPIYSVSRLITQAYKPYLNELNLTYPQYLVMLVLWEQDEVSVNYITKRLMLNTNTVSPLLKRMEQQKLIERSRSKTDERTVLVTLTKKGKAMKAKAADIPHSLLSAVSSDNMSAKEVNQLKATLCKWMDELSKKA
jgi:DNA-binding MarR family transcriptional regulator